MRILNPLALSVIAIPLSICLAVATEQAPSGSFKVTTTGVVIDVIAQDHDRRPVLDLTCEDFELREDKAVQKLKACPLVSPTVGDLVARTRSSGIYTGSASAEVPGSLASRVPAVDEPTVTALLFDRLPAEDGLHAVRAALAFVDTMRPERDYAGVFMADLSMRTFQGFTKDQAQLRAALSKVATTAGSNMRPEDQLRSQRAAQMDPTTAPTVGAEFAGGTVTPLERERLLREMNPAERTLTLMEYRMEQGYFRLLEEAGGQATMAGLRAAVGALAVAPGRKSLIYLSREVVISSRTKSLFEALIHEANRANVTVYAIDTAGLRVHNSQAALGREVAVAGAQGIGDVGRESGAWTRDLEKQEQKLSSGTGPMARLANETGGFLLENTNELASGMQRISLERSHYYLLLYESSNTRQDGEFRRVTIKVKRRGVQIRSRPGYVAAPLQR